MGLEYDKNKIEKEMRYKYMPYDAIFNLTKISTTDNGELIPVQPPLIQNHWVILSSHCTYEKNEFDLYIGTLVVDTLIEVNIQTNVPTGNIKPNVLSDPDYIAPSLNPAYCPTYQTEWIPDEATAICQLDEEDENTGFKIYTILKERIVGTSTFTGQQKPNTVGQPDYVSPITDPVMCPVTIEPPLETFSARFVGGTPYCITEDIVLNEFDYLVFRYNWQPAGGTDLDIMVGYVGTGVPEVDDKFVGFGQGNQIIPNTGFAGPDSYLWWALDNTSSSGYEAVLINVKKLIAAYPDVVDVIETELYCVWYNSVGTGDFIVEATTYLGGTMEVSGNNIINIGGEQVSTDSRNLNTTIQNHNVNRASAYKVGVLKYNKLTNTAILEIA